ncbi:MAG: thioredoxin domain-containing protein [Bdellovibrio sp.]|nr:thioredoxin domain-containing protein [Methylotenera sp.]
MQNHLKTETSPYLLQHADNPVEWYAWGEEALKLAREQDKPILLSIGYSACHWCHVMAHESFEDAEVATVMNTHFINIKVDREERPDIDQIYQTAHSMLSQKSGGWPLTVFLTPNQVPFFTGTYFPKSARYQLPGFADLIPRVAAFYHERKDDLAVQSAQLADALKRTIPAPSSVLSATESTLKLAFTSLESGFDFEHGGFGSAPKFPNPADITLLLHAAKAGNKAAEAMALQMLSAMANGGIYDQIGGGFCRYSVDERWNIPHFEKMLYDNGQLLFLYCDGWQLSKDNRYKQIVEETVAWLIGEMRDKNGAFYSSLDADSMVLDSTGEDGHSEEGAFYVWQPDAVKQLLTPEEFAVATSCFGFDRAANFENPHSGFAGWHPYLARLPEQDEIVLLMNAQTKLFDAREKRTRPGRDDKMLTSWNALAIKGLARAGRVFNRPDWVQFAQNAADFIRDKMWVNEQLLATCKDDGTGHYKAHLNAYLDDYAFLLDALIELMQADYRAVDISFAEDLADALLENFESEEGGFYFTSHTHEALIHRPKQGYDNATPNGNGIAAVALLRLGHILGQPRYLQSAERTLKAFDNVITNNPAACATLCHALEEFLMPPTLVVIGGEAGNMAAWHDEINKHYYPHYLFFYLDESAIDLPPTLQRNFTKNVNAWVCKGVVCATSVNDLRELLEAL